MVSSKNEARRLIEQGGVKINSEKINSDEEIEIQNGMIMQAGKRKFRKIVYGG
jgi:tyrosyl-tRNA synthetase